MLAGVGDRPSDGAFGLGEVAELSQTKGEVDQDPAQVGGVAVRLEGQGSLSIDPHRLSQRPAHLEVTQDARGQRETVGVTPASKLLDAVLGEAAGRCGAPP